MRSDAIIDQSIVIAFLRQPGSYAVRPERVDQHETHGAFIFLAGNEAYKIKRAVRFAYMDFSTLELRKNTIEREFEINHPQAPELYIGVVPITRDQDGGLHIGGTGTVVEWALHMRRFEQIALLGSIADRHALTTDLCRKLANVVRESHQRAPRTPMLDGSGRIARIIDEVTDAFTSVRATLDSVICGEFNARARAELSRAASCLDRRAREGHIRRCHGDLHLNNIVLWKGQPTLFDAIEFNDDIATVDTLYDLAFLLMDIDHRGLRREANLILNRYLWRSDTLLDLEGLIALPLFLGLRSAIRAMVEAQRAAFSPPDKCAELSASARSYLTRAVEYLQPAPARLVAVGGLSGTGKSTLAAVLAPRLGSAPGALHIRTDIERKTMLGVEEETRLSAENYSRGYNDKVYDRVYEKATAALSAGHSVIVDAVFTDPAARAAIERIAADAGVPFTGLWLTAPRETLLTRVANRVGDASDATPAVVDKQVALEMGTIDWIEVDASGSSESTERAAGAAIEALTEIRAAP